VDVVVVVIAGWTIGNKEWPLPVNATKDKLFFGGGGVSSVV